MGREGSGAFWKALVLVLGMEGSDVGRASGISSCAPLVMTRMVPPAIAVAVTRSRSAIHRRSTNWRGGKKTKTKTKKTKKVTPPSPQLFLRESQDLKESSGPASARCVVEHVAPKKQSRNSDAGPFERVAMHTTHDIIHPL